MIGESLGSYRVLKQLGEGGMGVVYLAEHSLLGRKAAIKLLLPELSRNTEIVTRFFNEARATTLIRHAGIVEVFDFGYHASGSAYIVMEFLEGESLAGRLHREPIPTTEVTRVIGRQIAGALSAAHEKGIVHRDLKPDNVYLTHERDYPLGIRVKLLDFGIAKLAGEAGGGSLKTRTGSVMGTPMYMAPEQCRGAALVDQRADVYSLGCILFEMACGRTPFTGGAIGEIMGAHLHVPPPAPHQLNPAVPAGLDALIQRMLAKAPEQRPQNMDEVRALLDAPEDGRAVQVVAPGPFLGATVLASGSGFPASTPPPPGTVQLPPGPVTTMSYGAAEVRQTVPAGPPRGRAKLVIAGLATVAVAGAVVAWLALRGGGGTQAAAPFDAERACAGADLPGCLEHAARLEAGDGMPASPGAALGLLQRACQAGSGDACTRAAGSLLRGHGVERDATKAAASLQVGCDAGALPACALLAALNVSGDGVATDFARALSLGTRSCDGGAAQGCGVLAWLYRWGQGVGQDLGRAAQLAAKACESADPRGCALRADMLHHGIGGVRDAAAARTAAATAETGLARACENGDADLCLDLSRLLGSPYAGRRDPARASALAQKACDHGVGPACVTAAGQFMAGRGVAPDPVRGQELFRRGAAILSTRCDRGNSAACTELGGLHRDGSGVTRDPARAVGLLQRGCEGNDGAGCLLLAALIERGQGASPDKQRSAELFRRAAGLLEPRCRAGSGLDCLRIGRMYGLGLGFARDPARALTLLAQACELEEVEGCVMRGSMYAAGQGIARDDGLARAAFLRAVEVMEAACTAGDLTACDDAGRIFAVGPELIRDLPRGATLYRKACDGGAAVGCFDLAWALANGYGVAADRTQALALYDKACTGGNADGCNNLAEAYRHGQGVALDPARAANLFEKGCDLRNETSCLNLSTMFEKGEGVPRDRKRADQLLRLACDLGNPDACKLTRGK